MPSGGWSRRRRPCRPGERRPEQCRPDVPTERCRPERCRPERSQTGAVPAEPGAPGELPDDVLATDAGLTELPDRAADDAPTGTVDDAPADTVDEARVAEILAESADADVVVVDETTYEHAVADAAPEPPPAAEADVEVVRWGPEVAEPDEESTEAGLDAGEPSGAVDEEPTERELAAPVVEEPTVSIRPRGGRGVRPRDPDADLQRGPDDGDPGRQRRPARGPRHRPVDGAQAARASASSATASWPCSTAPSWSRSAPS